MGKRSEVESKEPTFGEGRDGLTSRPRESRSRLGVPSEDSSRTQAVQPKPTKLRCVWHTRVVVPEQRTATGRRYQFDAGQVQAVNPLDVSGLLALQREQPRGCCGSESNPRILKFFEKA